MRGARGGTTYRGGAVIGVFVQLNESSQYARAYPIGYVIQGTGCWDWVGSTAKGYGAIRLNGRLTAAHRWVYEMHKGPIPTGLELDHLCRNPTCVNPAHLEPVTHRTNIMRGCGPSSTNPAKTHCPRGHQLSGDNLLPSKLLSRGFRECRQCHRERARRYYHRKRTAP